MGTQFIIGVLKQRVKRGAYSQGTPILLNGNKQLILVFSIHDRLYGQHGIIRGVYLYFKTLFGKNLNEVLLFGVNGFLNSGLGPKRPGAAEQKNPQPPHGIYFCMFLASMLKVA